jgi:hypothetical protein
VIEGQTITLGGKDYVVPPLNFKALRLLAKDITHLTSLTPGDPFTPEQAEAITRVVHSCLVRNYPDMTQEDTEDLLDVSNMEQIVAAVMGVSGFTKGEHMPVEERSGKR